MKTRYFLAAAAIMAIGACTKNEPSGNERIEGITDDVVTIEFSAALESAEDENVSLKTALDESKTKTLWNAGDCISIFDGSKNNQFTTDSAGETARFTGTAAETETYYALYPYQAEASFNAGSKTITATVPAGQTAFSNSFDPKATLMIARSTDGSLAFKNVCSMIKVTVSENVTGLSSISVKSNDGSYLAGKIDITLGEDGMPAFTVAEGRSEVVLSGSFEAGKDYFISILPSTMSGMTVTYNYSDGRIQKTKADGEYQFNRARYRFIGSVKNPAVIFPGITTNLADLDIEAKTAVNWMLDNVKNSAYVPFTVISDNGTNNVLSNCAVLWWHFHRDWSVNGLDNGNDNCFNKVTSEYLSDGTVTILRNWNNAGGSMFLTRYAVFLANRMGVNRKEPDTWWGGTEQEESGWTVSDNQWFYVQGSNRADSPYFRNCLTKDDNDWSVFMHAEAEAAYYLSNSTCHYSTTDYAGFETETGNTVIAKTSGDSQQVIGWECHQAKGQGLVTCFSTPLYDWYSINGSREYAEDLCHNNVMTITRDAIEHLKTK